MKDRDMDVENIINAIRNSRVRITDHADEEAFDDSLTYEEIYSSVIQGEVIEDYLGACPRIEVVAKITERL